MDDDQWTFAQTLFGITTYYRNEQDGSLSIKMEGRLEGVSLFDQVAVLREVDLHYKWAPFVSSSLTVAHLNKLDTVGWFVVGLPSFGLMRDACFRAIGCDSMLEDGSILLVGQGVADRPEDGVKRISIQPKSGDEAERACEFEYLSKDPVLKELDLPEPPTRIGSGRMTIRTFQSLIHVESPVSARTRIIANVDPNLPLIPQSLLDFLMKKLCGVLLTKLQSAAKRVSKDPINNAHASKMRQEEEFYKKWLMVKFAAVCKRRHWTMPPVTSFELTDQQLELAKDAEEKKNRPKASKTLRIYHSSDDNKLEHYLETDNASEPANIGQRSPRIRTMSNGSMISDISQNSSASVWQNNPITSYLRELEEKTQLKKAQEIQKARARAANRLKPKQLDEEARHRLEELRDARDQRAAGIKALQPMHFPIDSTKAERKLIKAQHRKDWAIFWTSHGVVTRILVMLLLVTSLFFLLYMDQIFEAHITGHDNSFWVELEHDLACVACMAVSAAVHFLLCYVALMYAFSALHIGAIAGTQAKAFYSQNIHIVLAASSSSMVALSILQASSVVLLRWAIWQSSVILGFANQTIGSAWSLAMEVPPESIAEALSVTSNTAGSALGIVSAWIAAMAAAGTSVLNAVYTLLIESNLVGQTIWLVITSIGNPFAALFSALASFVGTSIDSYEGRVKVPTWREDAFHSTRFLLAHSGVFLLVLLAIFNLSAKKARNGAESYTEDAIAMPEVSKRRSIDLPTLQESRSGSPDSHREIKPIESGRRRAMTQSLSPQFATIAEEPEEARVGASPQNGTAAVGAPKRRRGSRWFGRRKPRRASQRLPSGSAVASR